MNLNGIFQTDDKVPLAESHVQGQGFQQNGRAKTIVIFI